MMHVNRWLLLCCTLCYLPRAAATVVMQKTAAELTAQADVVFLGRAETHATTLRAMPVIGQMPVTTYTFTVHEVLKGDLVAGATFEFAQAGGTLPVNLSAKVVMAPRGSAPGYDNGREYLLFLTHLPNGLWAPVGALQGQFRVHTHADGAKTLINGLQSVNASETNAALHAGTATTKDAAAPSSRGNEIPLEHVRGLIRSHTTPTPAHSTTPSPTAPSLGH